MVSHLAQPTITRRAALYIVMGLLLILCASFVPVGWSGGVAIPHVGSNTITVAFRSIVHLWSTDVVVPSLYRSASYTAYNPTSLVHRSVLRRLAAGDVSVWAQVLSAQGIVRHDAQQMVGFALSNLPAHFPLLM
ncbi:MAG: hypothetical protein IT324_15105 [Anaerolineae bacterium]|nr:hypothetical protein [Anaerolineae bacterium]